MCSCGPPHMANQKQDDQLEHSYSSYVMIRDVTPKTCRRQWMIGRRGERGSGISVLAARHDDDDLPINFLKGWRYLKKRNAKFVKLWDIWNRMYVSWLSPIQELFSISIYLSNYIRIYLSIYLPINFLKGWRYLKKRKAKFVELDV